MFGYKDFNEIYLDSSPHFRVEDISIPVVAMNAADDPFCPEFGMHYVVLFLVIFEIHQIIMNAWSQAVTFLNRKLHLHSLYMCIQFSSNKSVSDTAFFSLGCQKQMHKSGRTAQECYHQNLNNRRSLGIRSIPFFLKMKI